jgi:dolichol-phosphate mannosyltransferase
MNESDRPLFSIVIPIKNEEATIPGLAAEVDRAMAGVDYRWEALWIDDGSSDRSLEILRALKPPHRYISFDRNHGQSAAFVAGFQSAIGTWVGTIDGDGQNDPADLPRLLGHALESKVDMVNGIRAKRQDTFIRKVSSRIGNGTRNFLTKESVRDVGCSTRVIRRTAVLDLPFFHGMHRFLPTLVRMRGGTIAELPVNHRPRAGGMSKYGINNRLWSGLRDIFGVRWLQKRSRSWKIVDPVQRSDS